MKAGFHSRKSSDILNLKIKKMYTDSIIDLEDQLRSELIEIISSPDERAKAFTAMRRHNHNTIKAVLNDFRITLENKEESIISKFPIE